MSSPKNAKSNTKPEPALGAQANDLSDATVGLRAMISALTRAGFAVHTGFVEDVDKNTGPERDKAGRYVLALVGVHIENGADGPLIVADKKAKPANEKTPA